MGRGMGGESDGRSKLERQKLRSSAMHTSMFLWSLYCSVLSREIWSRYLTPYANNAKYYMRSQATTLPVLDKRVYHAVDHGDFGEKSGSSPHLFDTFIL